VVESLFSDSIYGILQDISFPISPFGIGWSLTGAGRKGLGMGQAGVNISVGSREQRSCYEDPGSQIWGGVAGADIVHRLRSVAGICEAAKRFD